MSHTIEERSEVYRIDMPLQEFKVVDRLWGRNRMAVHCTLCSTPTTEYVRISYNGPGGIPAIEVAYLCVKEVSIFSSSYRECFSCQERWIIHGERPS